MRRQALEGVRDGDVMIGFVGYSDPPRQVAIGKAKSMDWNVVRLLGAIRFRARRRKTPPAQLHVEELEPRLTPTIPGINRVVMVIEENHAFQQIIGSPAAPYINSLASRGALMTESFALTHPSQPNYLELFSGSTQGVVDDSFPGRFNAPNLASELLAKHRSFGGFSESLPATGYLGWSAPGGYVRRHNPWSDFSNVPPSENLPFARFPTDFTRLPTVSYVVPNLADDMHDGTVQQGDLWLAGHLAPYVRWAESHNSLLVVTWDEDDEAHGNRIATLFVGSMVQPGRYGEFITHANVLRTIEAMYALPFAGNTAGVHAITDVWRPGLSAAPVDVAGLQPDGPSNAMTEVAHIAKVSDGSTPTEHRPAHPVSATITSEAYPPSAGRHVLPAADLPYPCLERGDEVNSFSYVIPGTDQAFPGGKRSPTSQGQVPS
jgi:phosphatidylinositol-3-phosphatase